MKYEAKIMKYIFSLFALPFPLAAIFSAKSTYYCAPQNRIIFSYTPLICGSPSGYSFALLNVCLFALFTMVSFPIGNELNKKTSLFIIFRSCNGFQPPPARSVRTNYFSINEIFPYHHVNML